MPRLSEQTAEQRPGGIVIEVEPHKWFSRDISSGDSTRGFAQYL
jgi:hypothetical protein